jgi:hypothetical protein
MFLQKRTLREAVSSLSNKLLILLVDNSRATRNDFFVARSVSGADESCFSLSIPPGGLRQLATLSIYSYFKNAKIADYLYTIRVNVMKADFVMARWGIIRE